MSVNSFFQGIDLIPEMPDISHISFENNIDLPDNVYVNDFETNNTFQETSSSFSIGKYNEIRPNMNEGDLFFHRGNELSKAIASLIGKYDARRRHTYTHTYTKREREREEERERE